MQMPAAILRSLYASTVLAAGAFTPPRLNLVTGIYPLKTCTEEPIMGWLLLLLVSALSVLLMYAMLAPEKF
jgi:hypothetical protein